MKLSLSFDLEKFLRPQTVVLSAGEFHLNYFEDFSGAVDHLLSALSQNGCHDIPLKYAPYYGSLWPAAELLCDLLPTVLPKEKVKVLELGSGLGLPSMLAARLGHDVIAVDAADDAILLLEENLSLNHLSRHVRSVKADWQKYKCPEKVDVVIASDVLYEAYHAESLARVVANSLRPNGVLLVVDPCRWHYQLFQKAAESEGFVISLAYSDFIGKMGEKHRMAVLQGRLHLP